MTTDLTPTNTPALIAIPDTEPLARNPVTQYLAGLATERARTVQRQALEVMAYVLTNGATRDPFITPWHSLTRAHVSMLRNLLAERYAASTANRMLSALRGVLLEAWRNHVLTADQYQELIDIDPVRGETIPAGRQTTQGERQALMTACMDDETPAGARDAAIIGLMYACGLRRQEVAGLDVENYDQETGELKVLHGKGNKQRLVYVTNGAAEALTDWLDLRGINNPGPLFWPINKGGRLQAGQRMTPQAIYGLLEKRIEQAGITHLSPHDLRRSFVSDLLSAGEDLAIVAKMAGHASVKTTQRYDRRPEEAKRKAAGKLHIPYRRRKDE